MTGSTSVLTLTLLHATSEPSGLRVSLRLPGNMRRLGDLVYEGLRLGL